MRGSRYAVLVGSLGAVALGLGGCGGEDASDGDAGGGNVSVVATTTVLGDIAGQVASCGGGEVRTLMPVGVDPHDFAASSEDVTAMVRADLVVANGLGLEEGLRSAVDAAAQDGARVFEVAPALDPLPFGEEGQQGEEEAAEEDGHGSLDPHVWLDVSRMATAAGLIGDELTAVTGDDAFAACGAQAATDLAALDAEVRSILDAVPAESRVLIVDHDAFGYFAAAYDFDVAGVVIPGGSTLGEPSAAELADLVQTLTDTGVEAIFANVANPTVLVDAVAAETGTAVDVVELFVGSLGPEGSGAETYAGMMTTNAQRIADALAG